MNISLSCAFKEPRAAQVALSDATAEHIRDLNKKSRLSTFQLAWCAKHKLEVVYGSLANFTSYGFAGRLIIYVRWQLPEGEKYPDRLPASVRGLCELSHVLGGRGEKVIAEGREKLQLWLTTPRNDGSDSNDL